MSDHNIYYSPEAFGLRILGEVEFSSGCYEFDTSVLWQDVETKQLYVADDHGCSCPVPFEDIGRGDLKKIERPQDLIDYLEQRKRDSYNYSPGEDYGQSEVTRIDAECGELVMKAHRAVQS